MAFSISGDLLQSDDHSCYNFSHVRRGIAVIIVNNNTRNENIREGSERDTTLLQQIFTHYGFEIRTFCNMKCKELLSGLQSISREDHSKNDCFTMAISTHGMESFSCGSNARREDIIETQDELIQVRVLLDFFTDVKCPSLKGKPRLVFIQACRGKELDDGTTMICTSPKADQAAASNGVTDTVLLKEKLNPVADDTDPLPHDISSGGQHASDATDGEISPPDIYITPAPCPDDFLVMYATPPGYFAFRNKRDGSWFIRILADVLLQSNGSQNLMRELTKVIRKVAHEMQSFSTKFPRHHCKKQTPVMYSKLVKDIYLTPKIGESPSHSTS